VKARDKSVNYNETGYSIAESATTGSAPIEYGPWVQTNGPAGGMTSTIEIDPNDPNIVYAGGAGGGVYKSTDSGYTWTMPGQIVEPYDRIMDILFKPGDPQTIYAQTWRLYKSTNGGTSWQLTESFGMVSCCAVAPGVLLVGTHNGRVYHSSNDGASWANITGNLPGDRIMDIAIGASNEYWAGTANSSNGRLYHTTNGGASWGEISIDKGPDTDIQSIFVDPEDTQVVYVGLADVHNEVFDAQNDKYLFKTTNGGTNWIELYLPFVGPTINILGRDLTDGWLYVGGGTAGVFKSNDSGQTWTHITSSIAANTIEDIAINPDNVNILFLPQPRNGGIYRSSDGGTNWMRITAGLRNTSISLLAVPNVPGIGSSTVYASARSGEGTFKTNDFGGSWTYISDGGITHPYADELVISPHDPETVWYVADVAQVFRTTDGGATWSMIIEPFHGGTGFRFGSVYAMAPAASNSNVIYALKNGFGIFRSDDLGNSWRFLHQSQVDYSYSIAVHPTNPDIVYSGYLPKPFQDYGMVRKSTDGGASWTTSLNVSGSGGITSVAIDPTTPTTVYAGSVDSGSGATGGEIYKSTNSGSSWNKLNDSFIMCTVWGQPQLIVDPDNSSIAYAGTWLAGTWKTTDAGANWTELENAPASITSISMNQSDTNVIYCTDRTAPKVWKTTDAGSTWNVIANFISDGAFLANRVFVDGDTVYAATFGPGIHGGKLYKSTNAGTDWNDITGTLPRSVLDISVHPTNKDIVYVTTHIHGAYKSTNGGTSWSEMTNFPDIGAYDIEVDQVDPTIVYTCGLGGSVPSWCLKPSGYTFGDDPGVYKSTDSGSTWTQLLTTSNECRAIRMHPDDHTMLFAAAMDDGLQVSTNSGSSWTTYNSGLATTVLTSCAVNGTKIYCGSQACGVHGGDVNTGTGAVTWQSTRSNKPVPDVYSMEIQVDPTNSNRIFVGANPGGLYRSDDGGATFYDKNFLTPTVIVDDPFRQGYYTFAINENDTDEVWVSAWGKGIYKSYDGMDFNIGAYGGSMEMWGKHIYSILIDGSTVYAAAEEGIFKTTNDGDSWSTFNTGLESLQVRTLAMAADGTLLCGTLGYELYYYDSPNNRWRQRHCFGNFSTFWPIWGNRGLYQYTSLLFHPTDPNIIYFGTFPAGIYKSTDAGNSWLEKNVGWTNDGVFSLIFNPQDANTIYAGTYNGLNRSTNAAAHWQVWDNGWPGEQWVFSIDFDPCDPNVMYACSKNGENMGSGRSGFHGTVMKSTSGGANWFEITSGLDKNQEFYKIIVDKYAPDTLYLATQRDGVFISYNGGASWNPWNEGLTNTVAGTNGSNIANTMVLSSDGCYLYFGTTGSGVFRRAIPCDYKCTVDFEELANFANQWLKAEQGLASHWKFDEGGDDTAYDSASDNHGTLINDPVWVAGKVGNWALNFDGLDDYVNVGDKPSLDGNSGFSISAWFKFNDTESIRTIFAKAETSGAYDGYACFVLADNTIDCRVYGDSANCRMVGSQLSPNIWYHVILVYDGDSSQTIYINGYEDTADSIDVGDITNDIAFTIGSKLKDGPFYPFDGTIDDVRFYNRPLSAEDAHLLLTHPGATLTADLNGDGWVDFLDFAMLADVWLADCSSAWSL